MENKVLQLAAALLGTWLAALPAVALERGDVPERYKRDFGSLIGGMMLTENILGKDAVESGREAQGREAFLKLLKSGSSRYPVEPPKDAGVDTTTWQPFDARRKR